MNLSNAANFISYLYANPLNERINIITVDGCSYFITDPLSFAFGKFPISYLKGRTSSGAKVCWFFES